MPQTHTFQQHPSPGTAAGLVHPGIHQRQGNVVLQAHARQEVEPLKNESQGMVAQSRQRIPIHPRHIGARQKISPATGSIETPQQIHEGRFTGTGGPHDGKVFATIDTQVDPA